jgi:hypothetical protein
MSTINRQFPEKVLPLKATMISFKTCSCLRFALGHSQPDQQERSQAGVRARAHRNWGEEGYMLPIAEGSALRALMAGGASPSWRHPWIHAETSERAWWRWFGGTPGVLLVTEFEGVSWRCSGPFGSRLPMASLRTQAVFMDLWCVGGDQVANWMSLSCMCSFQWNYIVERCMCGCLYDHWHY